MKDIFKWILAIILGILACPFLLAAMGFIIVLLELVAALIIILSPFWIPIASVGVVLDLLMD